MPNDPNTRSKKNNEKRSFYIALSVCLLAAAAAAWSTYAGILDYVRSSQPVFSASSVASVVSEAPSSQPRTSSLPSVSSAASSEEEPETSTAAPTTAETEDDAVPAAAYSVSTHFLPPVTGKVQFPYSGDTLVYNRTMRDWRTHPGCDFACEEGESVLACANGQVIRTYTDTLWGNVVEVEHGDYTLRYCGVGEHFMVNEGDVLRQGQVSGLAAAVPCEAVEELHIHLEAFCGGEAVDPAGLFS